MLRFLTPASRATRRLDRAHGLRPLYRPLRLFRTALRRALLRLYRPPATGSPEASRLTQLAPGVRVRLDTRELVQREAFLVGVHPEIRGLIQRHVMPGAIAIDVGAHVGLYTMLMAARSRPGAVLACEPNPRLGERLRSNVALNGFSNVDVRQVALSDSPGEMAIHVPRDERHVAGASLQPGLHRYAQDAEEVRVTVTTLDELVSSAGLARVDFVKIDTEGMEPRVLAGGMATLRRCHPVLIIEYTREWWARIGADLESVIAALAAAGYRSFSEITWRGLRPLGPRSPDHMDILVSASARP